MRFAVEPRVTRKAGRAAVRLVAPRSSPLASQDHGPFRVELSEISRRRESVILTLRVRVEPRLMVRAVSAPTELVVRDEFGNDLAAQLDRDPTATGLADSDAFGGLLLQVVLAKPPGLGERLATIRGTIPVALAVRRDRPSLKLSLAAVDNQWIALGDHSILARETRSRFVPGRQMEVAVRGETTLDESPVDFLEDQIELRDASDRIVERARGQVSYGWGFRGMGRRSGRNWTEWVYPMSDDGRGDPVALYYYELIQSPSEVQFEFRDVGLP